MTTSILPQDVASATSLPPAAVRRTVHRAHTEAALYRAWARAFDKAADLLPIIRWNMTGNLLFLPSSTMPTVVYAVPPEGCDPHCIAFQKGNPCWHQAARWLIQQAHELTGPAKTLEEVQADVDELME